MTETKRDVFEEVLAEWRHSETKLIGEYSIEIEQDEALADRKETAWRNRFEEAAP